MGRYEVIKLLRRVGAELGWTYPLIAHLELLIGYTREADWAPGGRPIVWLSGLGTAIELGIKDRQVRRNEKRMMDLGALAFRDSSNHRRSGRRDSDGNVVGAFGVDLSPVAALLPRLVVAEKRQAWEEREHRRLKRKLSSARRRVRAGLIWAHQNGKLGDAAATAVWEEFQSAAPRTRAETPLEVLEARLETLERIDARLAALCDDPADGPVPTGGPPSGPEGTPNVKNDCKTSDLPPDMSATIGLQYKSTSYRRYYRSGIAATGRGRRQSPGAGGRGGPGGPKGKWAPPRYLVERSAGDGAGRDAGRSAAQVHLLGRPERGRSRPRAAIGISRHARTEACEVMGPRGALLALIVTAARHDRALVYRPGGYRRGITNASRRGELNLGASLHALAKTSIPGKDRSR